jgi:minor histocompatibility antigen H13
MVSESYLSLGGWAHYVPEIVYFSCRTPTLFLVPLGIFPSIIYVFYSGPAKSVFLTNVLALSFGHQAMSLLKIDSFKTGGILLSGLFFYDIWWVFGTKVVRPFLSFLGAASWRLIVET